MKRELRDTILIIGGILFFILSVVGFSQWISSSRHESPEVLRIFASSAIHFHDNIESTDLVPKIGLLIDIISEENIEDTAEIESMLKYGRLSARSYEDNLGWLQPTNDTLNLYRSLLREGNLIVRCYTNLTLAWAARQSGDDASLYQYCEETGVTYQELVYLGAQNITELNSLLED